MLIENQYASPVRKMTREIFFLNSFYRTICSRTYFNQGKSMIHDLDHVQED